MCTCLVASWTSAQTSRAHLKTGVALTCPSLFPTPSPPPILSKPTHKGQSLLAPLSNTLESSCFSPTTPRSTPSALRAASLPHHPGSVLALPERSLTQQPGSYSDLRLALPAQNPQGFHRGPLNRCPHAQDRTPCPMAAGPLPGTRHSSRHPGPQPAAPHPARWAVSSLAKGTSCRRYDKHSGGLTCYSNRNPNCTRAHGGPVQGAYLNSNFGQTSNL